MTTSLTFAWNPIGRSSLNRTRAGQYGEKELRAPVDEAHRHGLPITAHAHGAAAIETALEADDRTAAVTTALRRQLISLPPS